MGAVASRPAEDAEGYTQGVEGATGSGARSAQVENAGRDASSPTRKDSQCGTSSGRDQWSTACRNGPSSDVAVTEPHQQSLVHAQQMDGCWFWVCFPAGPYCYGCYRQQAISQDSFSIDGCCFAFIPLLPIHERWDRLPGTNTFQNHESKDKYSFAGAEDGCACTGPVCRLRISADTNKVAHSQPNQPLPLKTVAPAPAAPGPAADLSALVHGGRVQLLERGTRCGVSIKKIVRGYDGRRKANYIVGHLKGRGANPVTFRVDGAAGSSCLLWVDGDSDQKQLNLAHRQAKANTDVIVWNDTPPKPGVSRWVFHPDGTVSPDPATAAPDTQASAPGLVIGCTDHLVLVPRGDARALYLTASPPGAAAAVEEARKKREIEEHMEKVRKETIEAVLETTATRNKEEVRAKEEEMKKKHEEELKAKEEGMRLDFERRERELKGQVEAERRKAEEAKSAKGREEEAKLMLAAQLSDAESPSIPVAVNKLAGAVKSGIMEMVESKYEAIRLILGSPERSDLRECVGLTDAFEFGELVKNPLKAMRQEWMTHGNENDKANFDYVVRGAVDPSDYPEHVRESLRTGVYHGGTLLEGEFETGHEGMDLKDFVNHPSSRDAGLQDYHVAAMRLYTSSSYPLYNQPMREGVNPHPIKITMYCLAEGLKMLRKVAAKTDPESYAKTMYLWRGMKDREMDVEAFKARGGTELAPMSTTSSREVAFSYAGVGSGAQKSLLLRYNTKALSRGVLIDYLSMYPKEKEYLYPPLTSLTYDDRSEIQVEGNVTIVPVDPQMA